MITYNKVIDIHNNNNNNNDESIIEDEEKIHGNVDMDSDSQKEKPDVAEEKDPNFVLKIRIMAVMMMTNHCFFLLLMQRRQKKKNASVAKSTPSSSVTCANKYFRVINVYMYSNTEVIC
jgi:hypothetical protein